MRILRSEDIKRMNKNLIRQILLELKTATRKELLMHTGISNAAAAALLKEMVEDQEVVESVDASSGGRCPSRYTLNQDMYRILCIQLIHEQLQLRIYNVMEERMYEEAMPFHKDSIPKIQMLCENYHVKLISVSTPGIVRGDIVTKVKTGDNSLYDDFYFHKLKQALQLPMLVDNDVKCMLKGYHDEVLPECGDIVYLFFDDNGMGSAWMANHELIRGKDHMAGELGLLKYNDRTLNAWSSQDVDDTVFMKSLAYFVNVVICCMNPDVIVLAGQRIHKNMMEQMKRNILELTDQRFSFSMELDDSSKERIWKALFQTAMDELLYEKRR